LKFLDSWATKKERSITKESLKVITADVETEGLDPIRHKLYLIAYSINGGPVKVVDHDLGEEDEELKKELADPENVLRGHHITFDALFLHYNGYTVNAKLDDTRVLAYLNFPFEESGLKHLVESKLHRKVTRMEDFAIKPKKKELKDYVGNPKYLLIDGKYYDKEALKVYNKADVVNCGDLRNMMNEPEWYRTCEQPLTSSLYRAQLHGISLDQQHFQNLQIELAERLSALQVKLGELNPASPKQVTALFAKKYDLDKIAERTPAGGYKCDKMFLKNLAWNGDEDAKTLLEFRKLSKLQGTYVEPLLESSKLDGRVHGKFNQAGKEGFGDDTQGTATGRLTSSDPNLQNIPARTIEGKRIRQGFIASPGFRLFDADLKQIEPRLVAHYSQAKKLLHAYQNKLDTHGLFAVDIFQKAVVEELTKTERFIGKTSWLATYYGCSFKKLLWICEVNSDDPLVIDYKPYINEWDHVKPQKKGKILAEYKGFDPIEVRYAKWMFFKNVQDMFKMTNQDLFDFRQENIDRVKRNGYLTTLAGRRIVIEGLDSPYMKIRMSAERLVTNYQIQPSAAEMMKLSLVEYDRRIVGTNKGNLLACVHDEILGQIRSELANDEMMAQIRSIMCDTVKLKNVPVDTDAHWMLNWSEK
jgi:DNA polymerase-1